MDSQYIAMNDFLLSTSKRHILTVGLEDYFHVGAFNKIIQRHQWYRFETRFERSTLKTLDLLDEFNVKATFFVLGWIADKQPEIVQEVARRGHEIANRGYYHRSIHQMTPAEFRDDLLRAHEALERASGTRICGYRVAHQWLTPSDFWALEVLAGEGYAYDSSIVPIFRSFCSEPWRRFVHRHKCGDKEFWEFPLSTVRIGGWQVPIAGGNYFRQFPHILVKSAVAHWHRTYDAPFVMYFHVWELDPEQPRINAASMLSRIRQYRNLNKMSWVLRDYFEKYHFCSIAEYLGIDRGQDLSSISNRKHDMAVTLGTTLRSELERVTQRTSLPLVHDVEPTGKPAVSIVVPCFNEELVLPYLANTLQSVEAALAKAYELRFVFVEDGSVDGTWDSLQRIFGSRPNCTMLRHTQNFGVAAAILTGIRHADTEVVCSIDCDCTYDPHELSGMIPQLTEDVAVVTASPYHVYGVVRNVPAWRLALSKTSSFLYRRVLRQKLATYTSCFRVYRRSAVVDLFLKEGGFLGIAEMIGKLDLQGSRIVEYPTTLEGRMLGRSKMKTLKTVVGHLRLLARLLIARALHSGSSVRTPLGRRPLLDTPPSPVIASYPLLPHKTKHE